MPPKKPRQRLLIFVIAYYAESTLRWVLERIPASIFADYDCEVLVVDDASQDRTFDIGREYQDAHPELPMTVLRNEYNQGYGGNQKVGYAYAIAEGFDFVAMVHGDGQYAPEELPRLLAPLRAGEADAVFGSRMMSRFGALKGGMPLYKYVGNKILTTSQNALLGATLSEFHSGYRVYSVAALRPHPVPAQLERLPLRHRDHHPAPQLRSCASLELPIPTYYGDEICRVNGMKYAKDVMLATLRNVAHRAGCSTSAASTPSAAGQPALRPQARLREQPHLRARRGARGAARARHRRRAGRHRARARRQGLRGHGGRSVSAPPSRETRIEVHRAGSRRAARLRRRRSTTTCCCSTSSST